MEGKGDIFLPFNGMQTGCLYSKAQTEVNFSFISHKHMYFISIFCAVVYQLCVYRSGRCHQNQGGNLEGF